MDYETIYVPDEEFKMFVRTRPYELFGETDADGNKHMRWLVEVDGVKKVVRPESAKV